jgi:perosamine synthetase
MNNQFKRIVAFIRKQYGNSDQDIPLHAPFFGGNERRYLNECIDSTLVSSVGKYVDQFEHLVAEYTGAGYAVATVNGTAALHVALVLGGVQRGDEVLTQAVTFVATANAITYSGASPVFLDSDLSSLGLNPEALESFLSLNCELRMDGFTYNRRSGKRVRACVCMHVFGHPTEIDTLKSICNKFHLVLIEDAAESLGSHYKGRHTGTFGELGILSFNGNKTITTGGGGMILTNNEELGKRAKHLTTTAKVPHPWEYRHDCIGFNYRMPNINAALGCAQMEQLVSFLKQKRGLAESYKAFFEAEGMTFVTEPKDCRSNFWLNAIILKDREERDAFLAYSNAHGVMTRPLWSLMPHQTIYESFQTDNLLIASLLEERLVNIPSGVRA